MLQIIAGQVEDKGQNGMGGTERQGSMHNAHHNGLCRPNSCFIVFGNLLSSVVKYIITLISWNTSFRSTLFSIKQMHQ